MKVLDTTQIFAAVYKTRQHERECCTGSVMWEIHDHDDEVEEWTENGGRGGYTGNRGGEAVKT